MRYKLLFTKKTDEHIVNDVYITIITRIVCLYDDLQFKISNYFITCTVYLPTFSESNAWDFWLVMTAISENVRATYKDFRRFCKDFRTLPKMSEDIPTTFQHLRFEQIVDI